MLDPVSGGNAGGATPVPIPNTEVKSSRADGTAGATLWESRTLPGFWATNPHRIGGPFFVSGAFVSRPAPSCAVAGYL